MSDPDRGPGTAALAGRQVLLLNWRDVKHPQAGGAEQYVHRIATRWVEAGVRVTWLTSRPPGAAERDVIDGVQVIRAGGTFSLYAATAARLLRYGGLFDAVLDCQNGIPFFAPGFVPRRVAVVQVVHHVHQDQFQTRFPRPVAALGRFLEGPVSRRVYVGRATAAVSVSTRRELRARLGFRGPVFVVPNGNEPPRPTAGPRDPDPTVVLVSRLVPHKRVDLLLRTLVDVAEAVPHLRVEIIGDGPERRRLQLLAAELGLQGVVRFRGRLPDADRDELLERAWLTTSTSLGEGWGCTVLEAARFGVPCVAVGAPGIRDSVQDGVTGWVAEDPDGFGPVLTGALEALADDAVAAELSDRCRAWAARFTWGRSAELLARVVAAEMSRRARGGPERRHARSDTTAVARFRVPDGRPVPALRITDQVRVDGELGTALLHGCDELDAEAALARCGLEPVAIELATEQQLLAGATAAAPLERLPGPVR